MCKVPQNLHFYWLLCVILMFVSTFNFVAFYFLLTLSRTPIYFSITFNFMSQWKCYVTMAFGRLGDSLCFLVCRTGWIRLLSISYSLVGKKWRHILTGTLGSEYDQSSSLLSAEVFGLLLLTQHFEECLHNYDAQRVCISEWIIICHWCIT